MDSRREMCRAKVVSQTLHPPLDGSARKARMRRSRVRSGIGGRPVAAEYEADNEARVWGEMDRTGVRGAEEGGVEELPEEMKARTSLWD